MSDTHATSTGTPKKTKTADIISKIINTIGVIFLAYGIWYYVSNKWETYKAKEEKQEILNTTSVSGQLMRQMPDNYTDENNECYIEVYNIADIYTDGEPVDFYPPGYTEPLHYSGKGRIDINGNDIHNGKWRFVSEHPNVLIRTFQWVN